MKFYLDAGSGRVLPSDSASEAATADRLSNGGGLPKLTQDYLSTLRRYKIQHVTKKGRWVEHWAWYVLTIIRDY